MDQEKNQKSSETSKVSPMGGDLEGAGTVIIRKAEKKDCKRLMELIHQLAVYERAPEEMTVTQEHFEESGFGEKPVWWGFVATSPPNPLSTSGEGEQSNIGDGLGEVLPSPPVERGQWGEGEVLGFALYYIRYSTWKGQRMYLEDFIVDEKSRGKGIGKLLFDALIEEAIEKKFNGIVWQVLDWNEPAINFYKKYDGVKFEKEWLTCSYPLAP